MEHTPRIPWNKGKPWPAMKGNQHAKGNTPWNKGKEVPQLKGNQHAKGHTPNRTSFKPGHTAITKYSVGTITTRKTKGKGQRQYIKTPDETWEEYAKWIWKQEYGWLLPGDVVHHLNGEKMDDQLENLIALPRKEHPFFHNRWALIPLTEEQVQHYKSRYPV